MRAGQGDVRGGQMVVPGAFPLEADRRRLAAVVIRRYFDWLAARSTVASIDTVELAAELDVLTDGWFSEATAKPAQP